MANVVLDLYKLKEPNCGLGQYCLHLGRAMAAQEAASDNEPKIRPLFHARAKDRRFIDVPASQWIAARFWRKEKLFHHYRKWMPERPVDLWHATDQHYKHLPVNESTPLLLTIHDLNFLREKHASRTEACLEDTQQRIDRAECVTTISNFVAGEIRQHLDLRGKPLHVIYNGACRDEAAEVNRPSFVGSRPFLFTIGVIDPKKNFHVLVPLLERLPEYQLIIAGKAKSEYSQSIRKAAAELGIEHRLTMPGQIDDESRQWLYANCSAFFFPSLTEGFGLPAIEAMHQGRPVFLSDRTSLPEVGGKHAFYWNNDDPEHMVSVFREGMQRFASVPDWGNRLKNHASQFTWQRAAQQYAGLYREMLADQAKPAATPLKLAS